MGQTLSEPVTTKESSICRDSNYNVASCAMQGWRISMEDAHTHLLACPDDEKAAFFAVYDGHGGARVAQFAGMHLHKRVIGHELFAKGDVAGALKGGFFKLDEDLRNDEETKEQMSGTTAVVVIVKDGKIYCGNAGDSRAVLCQQGKAVPLSFDHKPSNESEINRIVAAGGWVDSGRVNGNLALTRALGDFVFKTSENLKPEEQVVTADPDVIEVELTRDHEFIVLACDGIWDCLTNEQVVWYVRTRLAAGDSPEKICEDLVTKCLSPDCETYAIGCDNMSVVIVCLLQGDTPEEYLQRVQRAPIAEQSEFGEIYGPPGERSTQHMDLMGLIHNQVQIHLRNRADFYDESDQDESSANDTGISELEEGTSSTEADKKSSKEDFVTPSQSPLIAPHKDDSSDEAPPSEFKVEVTAEDTSK